MDSRKCAVCMKHFSENSLQHVLQIYVGGVSGKNEDLFSTNIPISPTNE